MDNFSFEARLQQERQHQHQQQQTEENYTDPADVSMQQNIKERLSHVLKRRLQETAPYPLNFENSPPAGGDFYPSTISLQDSLYIESKSNPQTPTKRRRSAKSTKNSNNSSIVSRSAPTTPTNRSMAPLFYDSASRDEMSDTTVTTPTTPQSSKDKNQQQPDILAQVLNQKKLALLQDPDVIQFVHSITTQINLNKNLINNSKTTP